MSDLSVQRLRRLLLLIPVVARAARSGRGVPLARAAEACGARSEAQLRDDIASVQNLWVDPGGAEEVIDLYVEDGEVQVTYAHHFGKVHWRTAGNWSSGEASVGEPPNPTSEPLRAATLRLTLQCSLREVHGT